MRLYLFDIRVNLILVFFCCLSSVTAQQEAQFTQYQFNTISVNPAYAGSRGQLTAASLYRSQWIGLPGAPETFTLNLHAPIRESKLGYGISLINDNIGDGTVQETAVDLQGSYTIDVSRTAKLSFGLNLSGSFLNLDFNNLRNFDQEGQNNPIANQPNISEFNPNFGVGLYYHTDKFYLGLSAPDLINNDAFDNNGQNLLSVERVNYFLITGYVFDLNPNVKFKPALLTKAVSGAPLQVDVSASFLFADRFSLGAAYRWDAAVSALVGFQLTDQFMLGLAYDREITELGATQFNDGSFEVFLRFELLRRFQRTVSPRFF